MVSSRHIQIGFKIHFSFLDAPSHLYKRLCPSVRRSVGSSVCPVLFSNDEYSRFEDKKSSNDIIINDTMSDDEEVASDVSPRYLFSLYMSFIHTRV